MRAEPAAIGAVVAAIINAIVLLLLNEELTLEQQTAIVSVVTLAWGIWTRSKVSPVG